MNSLRGGIVCSIELIFSFRWGNTSANHAATPESAETLKELHDLGGHPTTNTGDLRPTRMAAAFSWQDV
jgi:hypothetical protein